MFGNGSESEDEDYVFGQTIAPPSFEYRVESNKRPFTFQNTTLYTHNPDSFIQYTKLKIENSMKKELPKEFFVCHGKMALPLIKINDEFLLKYPCDEQVCNELMKHSEQAPFGRGEETIVDTNIRNSFQINKKIEFLFTDLKENETSKTNHILKEIQTKLCPGCSSIRSEFYKMLVYEKGSHFKRHKDTIRGIQHFGTLIIFLPTFYEGGEFQVRHLDEEEEYQFSLSENKFNLSQCDWVAFFTDCEHEIKKITKGNRVALTYHLYYEGTNAPKIVGLEKLNIINEIQSYHDSILDLIEGNPIVMMLSHQYSEKTLTPDNLKGKDATYFQLFARNQKYTVKLIPVDILVSTNEYDSNEDEAFVSLRDFESKVLFLNDWRDAHLTHRRNYSENETGNEGTEISYQYLHGAILISKNEDFEKTKKQKIDVDFYKEKIDAFFTPTEESQPSQQLGSQDDLLVVEPKDPKPLLGENDLINELYTIVRESSNNVLVILHALKRVTTYETPSSAILEFISFTSFLLLGFMFKTKEKLSGNDLELLKKLSMISSKYSTAQDSSSKRKGSKAILVHVNDVKILLDFFFDDCLKLCTDDCDAGIDEICDGNMEIEANESIELIKMRIIRAFNSKKFKEYKNLSRYLTMKIIQKKDLMHDHVQDHAKFLLPYSSENAFILYYLVIDQLNHRGMEDFRKLVFSMNKNREEYVGTLFNLCIETLSEHMVKNYPKNQKEACEILLTLADEKIAFVAFNLYILKFKEKEYWPSPEIVQIINDLVQQQQNYLIYNLCSTVFHYNGNGNIDKLLKIFLKSATNRDQLKKIYENILPKVISRSQWGSVTPIVNPGAKSIFFDQQEFKHISIDYLYHIMKLNPTYYGITSDMKSFLDGYLENENMEKIFENLEKTNIPVLSLYVIEKIEGNPKFKSLILSHLTFLFSNIDQPSSFGDNCETCKKVYKFLYNSSNKTMKVNQRYAHHVQTEMIYHKYQSVNFQNYTTMTKNPDDENNVQFILGKLRRIQNRLLGSSTVSKPIEISDEISIDTYDVIEID